MIKERCLQRLNIFEIHQSHQTKLVKKLHNCNVCIFLYTSHKKATNLIIEAVAARRPYMRKLGTKKNKFEVFFF